MRRIFAYTRDWSTDYILSKIVQKPKNIDRVLLKPHCSDGQIKEQEFFPKVTSMYMIEGDREL